MKARLYCNHCEKYYDVALKDVRLMQESNREDITFSHNTYYYENDCFFKALDRLKRSSQNGGASA